jgi:beta-lactamase superfamily II metal-dependent hydrolase
MKALLLAALALGLSIPATGQTAPLKVYFIDVEGGQATLFVTPAGQSLLIDTGWGPKGTPAYRDADRIAAAAHQAGLARIDYVLITHYHYDHVGGVPQLVARIPVGTFIDHGPNRETGDKTTSDGYSEFVNVLATNPVKEIVAKPGEHLPIRGIDATVISADGNLIAKPLAGAGKTNEFCKSSPVTPADTTENARSLGILVTFGKLRILDLGDLTMDKERELMCPIDKLGHVDILVVSHHGWYQSSSPALVHAIHPRIAIMDNGATKGGSPVTFQTLAASPGLEQLWQLHYSNETGDKGNQPERFIANPAGPDAGHHLLLTARPDGSFDILNSRTGDTQTYTAVHSFERTRQMPNNGGEQVWSEVPVRAKLAELQLAHSSQRPR